MNTRGIGATLNTNAVPPCWSACNDGTGKREACSLFFRIEYLQNSQVKAALHNDYGFTSGTCEAS